MNTPRGSSVAPQPEPRLGDVLARAPLPAVASLLALPGRARGVLLRDWSVKVARRYGAAMLTAVGRELAAPLRAVGDEPTSQAFVPIGLPLALHVVLAQLAHSGDFTALREPLVADGLQQLPALGRVGLRVAGPARILAASPKLHAALYDKGRVELEVGADAELPALRVEGGGLFSEPHWQAEQLWALDALMEVCGWPGGWRAADQPTAVVFHPPGAAAAANGRG